MRSAVLLLAVAVAGCTPMGYARPGATLAQARADEQECRGLAAREMMPPPLFLPAPYGHPAYRRVRPLFGDPLLDRMRAESDLADFCMRARGYTLQPLSP
jgi:hypothetical protein